MIGRSVEVKNGNRWVSIDFLNLTIGDVFRMFEPDAKRSPVSHDGSSVFRVKTNPIDVQGALSVEVDYLRGEKIELCAGAGA